MSLAFQKMKLENIPTLKSHIDLLTQKWVRNSYAVNRTHIVSLIDSA